MSILKRGSLPQCFNNKRLTKTKNQSINKYETTYEYSHFLRGKFSEKALKPKQWKRASFCRNVRNVFLSHIFELL